MSFRKYRILESKTESALKTTLAVKEEKIAVLEAQVKDTLNLNQQLQNDLNMVRVVLHIHFKTEQEQVVCTFLSYQIHTPCKNFTDLTAFACTSLYNDTNFIES